QVPSRLAVRSLRESSDHSTLQGDPRGVSLGSPSLHFRQLTEVKRDVAQRVVAGRRQRAEGSARWPPRCRNGATVPRSRLRTPLEPPLQPRSGPQPRSRTGPCHQCGVLTTAAVRRAASTGHGWTSGLLRGTRGARRERGALLLRRFRG
ncbi:unnamed protein product, partial [Ixodes persulcatus]